MTSSAFGRELKHWREVRRLSQLDLSLAAEVSQRHVSFLESGRATPSREMVVRLASVLDVPLHNRNAMLTAAGYAPAYLERGLDDPAMEHVRHVVDLLLEAHEPFPAHVLDRHWTQVLANEAAMRLAYLLPDPAAAIEASGGNMVRLTVQEHGLRSILANWEEAAAALLHRLARDVAHRPDDDELRELLEEAVSLSGIEGPLGPARPPSADDLLVPLHIRAGDIELRLFTSIATIGTPYDITLEGLRLETLLPADAASEATLRRMAAEALDAQPASQSSTS